MIDCVQMRADFMRVILQLILPAIILSEVARAQDSSVVFDQIYQGDFPVNLWGKQVRPAHLVVDQPDYLVTLDSTGYETFRFDSLTWHESGQIPFVQDSINRINRQPTWTVGDLNNDGADEIITWCGKTIVQYSFNGIDFTRNEYDFPLTVEQGVVGDIDNDGRNELVMFAFADSLYWYAAGRRWGHALGLCVTRLDSGKLKLIWADGGQMGYKDYSAVPPDMLHFIAPFTERDHNQLVITTSQSDASASFYHVLSWDYAVLRKADEFYLINGKKVKELPYANIRKGEDRREIINRLPSSFEEFPYSCGMISPLTLDGKQAFFDQQQFPRIGKQVILQPQEDHFKILPIIYSGFDRMMGSMWMDPDGKGKGFLGLTYLPYEQGESIQQMKWHYNFFRLHEQQ